jgi:malignant T-cell-amplified sequence
MFRKYGTTEGLNGRTQMKSSAQRGVKSSITSLYPKIEPHIETLIPKKEPVYLGK